MRHMPGWTFEEPNPITRCAIQLALAGPLRPATLREIAAMHSQYKRELPRKVEQPMLTLPITGGPLPFSPSRDLGVVIFDFINPIGQSARGLAVSPNFVNYFTTSYTRWEEFWPFASRLLRDVCGRALVAAPMASLNLEYHDRFKWEGAKEDLDLGLLFSENSRYLPSWFLAQRGICHNYEGWGAHEADPQAGRRIDNLNVAVTKSSDEDTFICTVVISNSKQFYTPVDITGFNEIFERLMNEMHSRNKRMLSAVLNKKIEERLPGLRE